MQQLGLKLSSKYSFGSVQVGETNNDKLSFIMSALSKLSEYLTNSYFKSLLAPIQASADNIISGYKALAGSNQKYYDASKRKYNFPSEKIATIQNVLKAIEPDVEKVISYLFAKGIPNNYQHSLQFFSEVISANINTINIPSVPETSKEGPK